MRYLGPKNERQKTLSDPALIVPNSISHGARLSPLSLYPQGGSGLLARFVAESLGPKGQQHRRVSLCGVAAHLLSEPVLQSTRHCEVPSWQQLPSRFG